jgi:hypothetical protein
MAATPVASAVCIDSLTGCQVLLAGYAPWPLDAASARLDVGVLARLLPLKYNLALVATPRTEFEERDRARVAASDQALSKNQACALFCLYIGEGERGFQRDLIYAWISQAFKHAEPSGQRLA